LGAGQPAHTANLRDWWLYPQSGIAVAESGFWWLRWDVSPLGYLSTAAHGHLDALHLSLWFKGVALVIDPGTGCYFANQKLRAWFASRLAHNGPCPAGCDYPRRLGCFLWSEHHPEPAVRANGPAVEATWTFPGGVATRRVQPRDGGQAWRVEDSVTAAGGGRGGFVVRWQFAPGCWVKRLGERKFSLRRADVAVLVEVSSNWAGVDLIEPPAGGDVNVLAAEDLGELEGLVSPAFRKVCRAPFLRLTAPAGTEPCVFTTTFLASPPS
jgi:hypothetical protein